MKTLLFVTILQACSVQYVLSVERTHYIAIEEVEWDYAPSGKNLIEDYQLDTDPTASVFTKNGPDRIGRIYTKAIYVEYTDDSYTIKVDKPSHLGFLGPPLRAEVGDDIIIFAKNLASQTFSFHPHGMFYTKSSEGALYSDNTSGKNKEDDGIKPGGSHKYIWEAREQHGPDPNDPACVTYMYHSHVDAPVDTNSGTIGPLIICRPVHENCLGTLSTNDNRNDVDKEFFLLFTVLDENLSKYLDHNIEEKCTDAENVDKEDEDFMESNKMHGLNGLMYGNLHGLDVCQGDTVAWHVFGLGTEVDVHTVYFQGQTVTLLAHNEDTFNIFPATFASAIMEVTSDPKLWRLNCLVNDHYSAGMQAQLKVSICDNEYATYVPDRIRNFSVAAKEITWDYGPDGINYLFNTSLATDPTSAPYFMKGDDRIGGVYKKVVFRGYTDDTFTEETERDKQSGILGPLIYGEVGDTLKIIFNNTASFPFNIEPHAISFDQSNAANPSEIQTYTWKITESVGPNSNDPDCLTLMYTSMVDPVADTNSGLIGPMIVCRKGKLEAELQKKTYYMLMTKFDENLSHYFQENTFLALNGLMYGNLHGVTLCIGEETNFRLIGLGTEGDIHDFVVDGVPLIYRTARIGAVLILPHSTALVTVNAEALGENYYGCYLNDHTEKGLIHIYEAIGCSDQTDTNIYDGVTRTYYIAAEEAEYDYNPDGKDIFGNPADDEDSYGYVFVHQEDGEYIGSKYKKAMYFEYTDKMFDKKADKPKHLGAVGPYIFAEEGDTIKVVFRNKASRDYNIFARGLPMTSQMIGELDPVKPGNTVTYTWKVPSSAVPPENQPECQSQIYISLADSFKDVYTGLIGPLITCRKGAIDDGVMDKSYFLLFMIFDENMSNYLDDNIKTYTGSDPSTFDKEDGDFEESNLMHSINGYLYDVKELNLLVNETYLWHIASYGKEVDLHTVHFHGNVFTYINDISVHNDVKTITPGQVATVKMTPDATGSWLLHCHVNDHLHAGMETTYHVDSGGRVKTSAITLSLAFILFLLLH